MNEPGSNGELLQSKVLNPNHRDQLALGAVSGSLSGNARRRRSWNQITGAVADLGSRLNTLS